MMTLFLVWLATTSVWLIIYPEDALDLKLVLFMVLPVINTGALIGYLVNYVLTKMGDDE